MFNAVEFFKSFAGPFATITASVVAGSIAIYFAAHQKNISFQQKEIAKEKLRLDLFDRRYKVYESIFDYYNALVGWTGTEEQEAANKRFFRAYQESKFLFGKDVEDIFKKVFEEGNKVKGFKENRESLRIDPEVFMQQFNQSNDILLNTFETKLSELTKATQRYIGFQNSGVLGAE